MKNFKALLFVCGLAFLWVSCDREIEMFPDGYNDQSLYEDTVSVEIDTNRFYIDYSKYTQARIFPGLISANEPRLEGHKVVIDLDYEHVPASWLRISVAPGNWMSTSMWAPAGELIIIDVPEGIYGLTAQIGVHTVTLGANLEFHARDPRIYTRQELFPGRNYLRNLYGGLVYILPTRPLGRQVELSFTGTALAPSFKLNSGMTNEQWKELVDRSTVPFFELEGDRIVFTLETAQLRNNTPIEDPTALMTLWDDVIQKAYWDWYGLTEGNPDPRHRAPVNKWRIVHDIQMPTAGAAQISGYPVHALWRGGFNYFRQAVFEDAVRNQNWGTYHELGHNMQMHSTWSFNHNGEVTCNLFSFQVARLFGTGKHANTQRVWDNAQPYLAQTNKDWNNSNLGYPSTHLDIRLCFFVQVMEIDWDLGRTGTPKLGFDFIPELAIAARNARFTAGSVDQRRVDFFYEELCRYAEMELEPYFRLGWGIFPSTQAVNRVQANGWPRLETELWKYNPVTNSGGDTPIPREIVELSKTGWTAMANSDDGATGRGVDKLIDNDATTVWHPCWNSNDCHGRHIGVTPGIPVFELTITTGASNVSAKGFTFNQRPSPIANHVKSITVEISTNGTDYTILGTYDLLWGSTTGPAAEKQFIDFDQTNLDAEAKTFRYIRFKIDKSTIADNNRNAVVAELGLFTF